MVTKGNYDVVSVIVQATGDSLDLPNNDREQLIVIHSHARESFSFKKINSNLLFIFV